MAKKKTVYELTPEECRADFHGKNLILQAHYAPIPPALFYSDFLFHDLDEAEFTPSIIMYEHTDMEGENPWKRQAVPIDDLMDYAWRDDVAINPCGYWNNYPRKKLMRRVYAFVMDVDEVRPATMEYLISLIEQGKFPRPTAISNSGSGVHFFYILDVALQVGYREKYLQNFRLAEQVYFMLHQRLGNLYAGVQRHHLGQDYRLVGSFSKFGDVTTAWEVGPFWQIEELAKVLKVDFQAIYQPISIASPRMVSYAKSIAQELHLALPDLKAPREVYDFIAENKDAAYKARQERRERAGAGKKRGIGWYEDTWNRVYTKTKAGNRFNSLRALAIVAYKCGVPEERFEEDLEKLSVLWQEQSWRGGDSFNSSNTEAIMRMFRNGERYKRTTRARLEELLGWKWTGSGRRFNGRTQAEHLRRIRALVDIDYPDGSWRNKNGRPTREKIVSDWRAEHPDGKKADCVRDTGLSKPTVSKWWEPDQVLCIKPDGAMKTKGKAKSMKRVVLDWKAEHPDGRKVDCIRDTGLSKPTVYKWWDKQPDSGNTP